MCTKLKGTAPLGEFTPQLVMLDLYNQLKLSAPVYDTSLYQIHFQPSCTTGVGALPVSSAPGHSLHKLYTRRLACVYVARPTFGGIVCVEAPGLAVDPPLLSICLPLWAQDVCLHNTTNAIEVIPSVSGSAYVADDEISFFPPCCTASCASR